MPHRLVCLALLVTVGLLPAGCSRKPIDPAVPTLAHPGSLDAGGAKLNAAVQVSFEVRNTGTAPLTISRIVPDCQCKAVYVRETKIAVQDLVIPPQGVETLAIDFMAVGQLGTAQKTTLQIHSNDPNQPVSALTISYVPTARLYAVPGEIVVYDLPPTGTPSFTFDLYADEGLPLVTNEPLTTDIPDTFEVKYLPAPPAQEKKLDNSYARLVGALELRATRPITKDATFSHNIAVKQQGAGSTHLEPLTR